MTKIKAQFFGAHIGCKVDVFGMAEYINGGVTWDEDGVFKFFDGNEFHPFDSKCRLILRPLSSLTSEEANIVATLMGYIPNCGIHVRSFFKHENLNGMPGDCMQHSDVIDYLRSINVCVSFMGINPIEVEWAILENKK